MKNSPSLVRNDKTATEVKQYSSLVGSIHFITSFCGRRTYPNQLRTLTQIFSKYKPQGSCKVPKLTCHEFIIIKYLLFIFFPTVSNLKHLFYSLTPMKTSICSISEGTKQLSNRKFYRNNILCYGVESEHLSLYGHIRDVTSPVFSYIPNTFFTDIHAALTVFVSGLPFNVL